MKQIKDCLNPRLVALCRKSVHLQQLQEQCLEFLDEGLRAHCQVSQFSEGRLVIAVSDPVWATTLRYELPALRDHLRSEAKLYQLRAIDIKIGFNSQPVAKRTKRAESRLSPAARSALQSLADACGFEPLKKALERLVTPDRK